MAGTHEVELFLQCAPQCAVAPRPGGFAIRRGPWVLEAQLPCDPRAAVRVYRGSTEPICGWFSRHYDQREPAPTIVWRARLRGPSVLRTELMCRSDYRADS